MMKRLLSLGVAALLSVPVFSATIDTRVGIQNVAVGNVVSPSKGTFNGSVGVADTEAKYENAVREGSVYLCSDLAGTSVTTAAGISIYNPILTIVNPAGSGVYLSIWEANVTPTAAPAAAAGLMWAYNVLTSTGVATTTAGTLVNAQIGNTSVGRGLCYRAAQLPAVPVAFRYFGGTTGAAAISGAQFTDAVDGKVLVPPGGIVSIQTTSAVAGLAHVMWEEVPYP